MEKRRWLWSVYLFVLGGLLLVLCYALTRITILTLTFGLLTLLIPLIFLIALICIIWAFIVPFRIDMGYGEYLPSRIEDGRSDGSDPRAKEAVGREIQNLNMSSFGSYYQRHMGGYDPRMNLRKKR
jgi:hypothetical protein